MFDKCEIRPVNERVDVQLNDDDKLLVWATREKFLDNGKDMSYEDIVSLAIYSLANSVIVDDDDTFCRLSAEL